MAATQAISESKIAPFTGALPTKTRQVILASPATGAPTTANFTIKEQALDALKAGQFLVRILYLSVDPYIRYYSMGPTNVGKVVTGYAVGDIIASNAPSWPVGAQVAGVSGATEYYISDGTAGGAMEGHGWRIVDPALGVPLSTAVGVLGMPGATAWIALQDFGNFPKGGTVVVSAAAGAVGNLYGQIARQVKGAGKVIGIAGGPVKCAALLARGFDVAIDYKNQDVATALRAAAPEGVDHYFDNVGGAIKNAVYLQIKTGGTAVSCGHISGYNGEVEPAYSAEEQKIVDAKNITTGNIVVLSVFDRWAAAFASLAPLIKSGAVKYDETIIDGIENQPAALISQLAGGNTGKSVIRLAAAKP